MIWVLWTLAEVILRPVGPSIFLSQFVFDMWPRLSTGKTPQVVRLYVLSHFLATIVLVTSYIHQIGLRFLGALTAIYSPLHDSSQVGLADRARTRSSRSWAPFPSFAALYLYPLNDTWASKYIALTNQHRKIGRQTRREEWILRLESSQWAARRDLGERWQ